MTSESDWILAAEHIAIYFNSLIEKGLERQEALQLTLNWQGLFAMAIFEKEKVNE